MQTVHINDYLNPVAERVTSYLKDDLGLDIVDETVDIITPSMLDVYHVTGIISAGGSLGITIAISFDKELISYATSKFFIKPPSPEEISELSQGVADELINIILGNASSRFPKDASLFVLTPPTLLVDAKNIINKKHNIVWKRSVVTNKGSMLLLYICDREKFDENLNYKI